MHHRKATITLEEQFTLIFDEFNPVIEKGGAQWNIRLTPNPDNPMPAIIQNNLVGENISLTCAPNNVETLIPTLTQIAKALNIPQGKGLYLAAQQEITRLSDEKLNGILPLMTDIMDAVHAYQQGNDYTETNSTIPLRGDNLKQHINSKLNALTEITKPLKHQERMHRLRAIMLGFSVMMASIGIAMIFSISLAIPGAVLTIAGTGLTALSTSLYKPAPETKRLRQHLEAFEHTYHLFKAKY